MDTEKGAGAALVAGADDRVKLAGVLLDDAEAAADSLRWSRARLRLEQLANVGDADETRVAAIRERADKIAKEGTDFTNGEGIELVWCPRGEFSMGSPERERGRESWETQHSVTLTSGFWIGKFEVTQAQYKAVKGENPSTRPTGPDDSAEEIKAKWPEVATVENVS